jgi:23S rRNA (guanosine2251-2'-O)-methyltransferase
MEIICGIHAVREALESSTQSFERLHVAQSQGHQRTNPRLQELIDLCRQRRIAVRFESPAALERMAKGAHHQGVVAMLAGHGYAELEDVLAALPDQALVLVLDGVQDVHNLGALIRTACAAGAAAVIIPERRAAGLTPAVVQAASGALAHTPVVRVGNLVRAIERLKQERFWTIGLDERAEKFYDQVDYRGRAAIIAGGEEKGLHELTRKNCDFVVRIPTPGKISTLNVSVATAIVLFEAARQRR